MKVGIVGAGPSGLYLAILLARSNPRHEITVHERNAPDATFGWGVVFSEDTLGTLRDADGETYLRITDTFARWDAVDISYRGELVRCRGHAFSAIARKQLLAILQQRATALGVKLNFGSEVSALDLDVDVLVGADGVRSVVRAADEETFRPTITPQGCKYVWFGTDLVFDAFRFIFAEHEHGLFQVHAYPFDEDTSTFIVETREESWRAAGLHEASEQESIDFCQELFAAELGPHRLMSNKSQWLDFPRIRTRSWHGTVGGRPAVLLGDAAHTAHFTIGSGTKLAMEDAVALANAFARYDEVRPALVQYEQERRPVVERFQEAAADSADYFTRVRHHTHLEPPQFAFNLLTRSGRISHAGLTLRDPAFVGGVDGWFAGRPVAPPPAFAPLRLADLELANRIVQAPGAGLRLTDLVAVTDDGRVHPQSPVAGPALREFAAEAHADGAAAGVVLSHAGARGATRTPEHGVDIPLPEQEAWPLLAASARAYAPFGQTPREATPEDRDRVLQAFADAARVAAESGFDLLELDCAHGRLLAGFLSPLTNPHPDRLRYPLEVLAAVRAAWPAGKPLSVRVTVTDWARGGMTVDDGVAAAKAMADGGADLVHVVAGQTRAAGSPEYRRGFLTAISDRVRSEAGVKTLVGGHLTTVDAVNTVLAAGRADLCLATLGERR